MTRAFYKRADGIALVFDLTNQASFESIAGWISSIKENAKEDIPVVLVGNKVDLQGKRVISEESALELADTYGLNYHETSAMDH